VRLDKFLQVSRLVKRRTLANQLCDGGHVRKGGRVSRASADVAAGEEIDIDYGWRRLKVRICSVPPGQVGKAGAPDLYEVLEEERRQERAPAGEE